MIVQTCVACACMSVHFPPSVQVESVRVIMALVASDHGREIDNKAKFFESKRAHKTGPCGQCIA